MRAQTGEAGWWEIEIGEEPEGIGCGEGGELGDQGVQLIGAEAIEEEVGGDEVEAGFGWGPLKDIGVDELHAGFIGVRLFQGVAGLFDHSGAGIDAGDLEVWIALEQRDEEAAGAFAEEESFAGGVLGLSKVSEAAALEFIAREEAFHEAVNRSEPVKAHAASGLFVAGRCFQMRKASKAPAA